LSNLKVVKLQLGALSSMSTGKERSNKNSVKLCLWTCLDNEFWQSVPCGVHLQRSKQLRYCNRMRYNESN